MDKKQQFVEETGIYFEGVGLPRMAGRIIGYLLICDPPHQSQPELVEALQASKSAISNAINLLLQLYFVEKISLIGDRRDYYKTAKDMWARSFRARMHQVTELKTLSERGLELLEGEPPHTRKRLEMMRDMNAFMAEEFPKLLDRWDDIKRAKGYDEP